MSVDKVSVHLLVPVADGAWRVLSTACCSSSGSSDTVTLASSAASPEQRHFNTFQQLSPTRKQSVSSSVKALVHHVVQL